MLQGGEEIRGSKEHTASPVTTAPEPPAAPAVAAGGGALRP